MNLPYLSQQYKRITFELINNLQVDHHEPGKPVMKQNDLIFSHDGEAIIEDDDGNTQVEISAMFFIIGGNYKVQSQLYE